MFLIQTCFDSDPTKRNSFNYVFMYIPIGPSKKQLYKIVIALLLLCYILFLGMYKPKALNVTDFTILETVSGNGCTRRFNFAQNSNSFEENLPLYDNTICSLTNTSFDKDYLIIPVNIFYQIESTLVQVVDNSVVFLLQTDVGNIYCDFENGIATCPFKVSGASTITQIRVIITKSNVDGTLHIRVTSGWYSGTTASQNINNIQNNTDDIKNNLNDSSIDSSSATSFKDNSAFQDSNGLDAIIKAPLNFIQSLTSSTCSSISLTIPYIDADVNLPCMSTIYNKALGQQLVNLIALVINGVILYRYCLKILQIVKDAKNPNKDGLEVLDL